MPYLTESDFNAPSGELNRAITKLMIHEPRELFEMSLVRLIGKYVHDQKPRYATFNDVVGALECAKMEYVRRHGYDAERIEHSVEVVKAQFYSGVVSPYEDKKIEEHGDIYVR